MILNTVGVFTTDCDLIVQVWDDALAQLTRIRPEDVLNRPLPAVIPDLECRGLIRHFKRVLEEGVIEVLAPAFHRYLIPCAPQSPSPRFDKMLQHVTIAPLLEQDGRIAGLIATLEDVTLRIDSERDIVEHLKQPGIGNQEMVDALEAGNWRIRREAVEQVVRRAAPDAIKSLLISVRDNHRNLGLLNSALTVLRNVDVDTHTTLLEFLAGPDPDLRMQAALALGEQKDVRAIPSLVEALKDKNANVAYHAIEALGKLRAQEAVGALAAIAESKDFFLSFPALEALGEIGRPEVTSRLIPLLQDPMLRDATARTLGMLGDESSVKPLVHVLNAIDAPTELIAQALASVYNRYETGWSKGQSIVGLCRDSIRPSGVQNLIDALSNAETESVHSLVLLLGWINSPAASRALTRCLGSPDLRNEIVGALVNHGPIVTDLLLDQLRSEDLEIRTAAVKALGRIRDRRATLPLIELLGEDEESIIPLIGALASIGDPAAVDPIFTLLRNPDAAVRQAAVSALNTLASPKIVERVIRLLEDPWPGVREAALRILGHFATAETVNALLARCHDENDSVRRAAVEQLRFVDDRRVPGILSQALRQEVSVVRAAAAEAMAHVAFQNAVPYLTEALADGDPWVRYFSARSLAVHRAVESASDLYRLAGSDRFHQVRIAAFEALSRMDEKLAASVAESFMSSTDDALRQVASTFLASRNGAV